MIINIHFDLKNKIFFNLITNYIFYIPIKYWCEKIHVHFLLSYRDVKYVMSVYGKNHGKTEKILQQLTVMTNINQTKIYLK